MLILPIQYQWSNLILKDNIAFALQKYLIGSAPAQEIYIITVHLLDFHRTWYYPRPNGMDLSWGNISGRYYNIILHYTIIDLVKRGFCIELSSSKKKTLNSVAFGIFVL